MVMRGRDAAEPVGPATPAPGVVIRLAEDMYAPICEELHRSDELRRHPVSRELWRCVAGAASIELERPWPERLYVVTCSSGACSELRQHLEKALRHAVGVRRGALSRALLRIGDAEREARSEASTEVAARARPA